MDCELRAAVDEPASAITVIVGWVSDPVEHYYWCGTIMAFPARPDALSAHISAVSSPDHHVWAVYSDGALTGFGEVEVRGDVAVLRRLLVDPARRGHGVGTAMVAALLADARQCGATTVELDVSEPNLGARRCYARCGFRIISTAPAPDRPWNRFRMAADL